MKLKFSKLILMFFSAGLLALGTMSCATPAVKKPDIKKPSPSGTNQGGQTASTMKEKGALKEMTPKGTLRPDTITNINQDTIVVVKVPTPDE